MKTSSAGRSLIENAEGLRTVAYLCPAGVPSIGYGHTRGVHMGMTCTKEQADAWLEEDLADAEEAINTLVKVPLTQGQYDALVSFVFNFGARKFGASTLLVLLNTRHYAEAAKQFRLWCHGMVDGEMQVLPGLVKRRAAENDLFLNSMKEAA